MGILTLISSQRQPKMDSEGDSESSEFEEKAGRKILLAKKKVPPHSGRDTWQKLRLPTSQVYTLENANSNFLSKPPQWYRVLSICQYCTVDLPPPVHFSICTEGFPYLNISKKPIQFVWERYQNHKFNCVCVFLVS